MPFGNTRSGIPNCGGPATRFHTRATREPLPTTCSISLKTVDWPKPEAKVAGVKPQTKRWNHGEWVDTDSTTEARTGCQPGCSSLIAGPLRRRKPYLWSGRRQHNVQVRSGYAAGRNPGTRVRTSQHAPS